MSSKQVLHHSRAATDAGRLLVLLIVATCLVGNALTSTNCKICHSIGNYEECLRNSSVPCTVALVNSTHQTLVASNPTLRNSTYVGIPQFQCFQVNYTVGVMWHYQMGCTYATTKFCEGWRSTNKCSTTTSNVMGVPGRVRVPHIADYSPNAPPLQIHPHTNVQHPGVGAPAAPVQRSTKSASGRSTNVLVECLLLSVVVCWVAKKVL